VTDSGRKENVAERPEDERGGILPGSHLPHQNGHIRETEDSAEKEFFAQKGTKRKRREDRSVPFGPEGLTSSHVIPSVIVSD